MLYRLKDLREYGFDYEIQQRQIAEFLNISQPAYSQIETGDRMPTLKQIYLLSNFYNTNIDYILNLTNKKIKTDYHEFDLKVFGDNIKDFRINDLKISQSKLAKELNVSQDTIAVCERKERLIPVRCAINISIKYNISIDYLFGKTNNKFIK